MGAVTDRLNATNNEDKDKIAPAVEKILAGCTDPTTGKLQLGLTALRRQVLRQQAAAQATVQVLLQATVAQAHQVQVLQAQGS